MLGCGSIAPLLAAALVGVATCAPISARSSDDLLASARTKLEAGRYREAEIALGELWPVLDKRYGSDSLELADATVALIDARLSQGWWPTAVDQERLKWALRLQQEAGSSEHGAHVEALHLLGVVTYRLYGYAEAAPLLERSLAIAESRFGSEHPCTARILVSLAEVRKDADRSDVALALLDRALATQERELGTTHPRTALTLGRIAYMRGYFEGRWADAAESMERRLPALERDLGTENPLLAQSYKELGNLYLNDERPLLARHALERGLALAEGGYGAAHPVALECRIGLACVHRDLTDYERALELFEGAIEQLERARGAEDARLGSYLFSLGRLYRLTGDYRAARRAYERSLVITEKRYSQDHPFLGLLLGRFAMLLTDLGDLDEARHAAQRALRIFEQATLPNPHLLSQQLGVLSLIELRSGRLEAARAYTERFLSIADKAGFRNDDPELLEARSHLARILAASGEIAAARQQLENNLAHRERVFGRDHQHVASTLQDLAGIVAEARDDARAVALLRRSISIRERLFGGDHPSVGHALAEMARSLARLGKTQEALRAALWAERITRGNMRLTAQSLPERQALRLARSRVGGLNVALSIIAAGHREPDAVHRVWDSLTRSRALVLDELASRHQALREQAEPDVVRLNEELAVARASLANIVVRGAEDQSPAEYRKILDFARKRKEQLEWSLADRSLAFRAQRAKHDLGLREVAASLPPGSALLSYVRYYQHAVTTSSDPERNADPAPSPGWCYAALVLGPDGQAAAAVPLGEAGEIEELASAWKREASAVPGAFRVAAQAAEWRSVEAGLRLRETIWDPVARELGGASRVLVVPAGALHFVNLPALPIDDERFLLEAGPALHVVSAERDIARPVRQALNTGLLALGGVDFDAGSHREAAAEGDAAGANPVDIATSPPRSARSGCEDFRARRFSALPGTVAEVAQISALWRRSLPPERRRTTPMVQLSGRLASEAAFKRHASRFRVLHLATHGFFFSGQCEGGTPAGETHLAELLELGTVAPADGESPLLLAGVALAGANGRDGVAEGAEDGILTAEEIAALDLSGVEWVVLSTCESGAGELLAGEGVLGLRRAFQIAGARTLITSLWPVQDDATRHWMRELYAARCAGLPTAAALRHASLRILEQRRKAGQSTHPFYWGGFVAAGDWR